VSKVEELCMCCVAQLIIPFYSYDCIDKNMYKYLVDQGGGVARDDDDDETTNIQKTCRLYSCDCIANNMYSVCLCVRVFV
jgi:hypothetical protein